MVTSGKFDLYGSILDDKEDGILGDLKVTSSFKLMKALGIYKEKSQQENSLKRGLKRAT